MSNIKKIDDDEFNYKNKVIDFIGSPEFLPFILEQDFSVNDLNNLLSHHVLTLLFQSQGIKYASLSLEYFLSSGTNMWQTKIRYDFLTVKNVLVSSNDRGNRTSIRICNKNHYYPYRDSMSLRTFLEKFNDNFKSVDLNISENVSISYNKVGRNKKQHIISYYDNIVSSNSLLNSILLHHFLKKDIIEKPIENNRKVMKV